MHTQPNSDKPNSLEITGGAKPNVPAFVCLVYVHTGEDAMVVGRVANLADRDSCDIRASGSSEREVLSKLMREFKSRVSKLLAEGQEIPWIDPPEPP